jgi:hypothetical protein
MVLFGKEWPTVITWRFRKDTGGEEYKEKAAEQRISGDNHKGNSKGGRLKDKN